jgi:predicted metal-dependent hydrolase
VKLKRTPVSRISVDGLDFAVRWSKRRRTIGISVGREGELRVLAPARLAVGQMESAVRAKLPWVRRKLAEFAAQAPPPRPKRFVEGERLPYLGRAYRLVLVDDTAGGGAGRRVRRGAAVARPRNTREPFALRRGRFELLRSLDGEARAAAVRWYTEHAQARLTARVAHFAPQLGSAPAAVVVRDLGKRRWGSCDGAKRVVSFHWELVLHHPQLIDYVVVHELAHLRELNHGRAFWRHVERVLPDCRERRARLAALSLRHVI